VQNRPYPDAVSRSTRQDDVEIFADLDPSIQVFDRRYLDYERFCALKECGKDFMCLLQVDARVNVLERIEDIDITGDAGTRHVSGGTT